MATVILGSQFGDEGKGKLCDILSAQHRLICRCQGGNNAGHTVQANGVTYDLHILPSGIVNPSCINLVGSGCVVHVPSFFKELATIEKHGIATKDRIFISDRAHIVFDLHQLVDGLEEVELGKTFIGTTKKGIGPTYSTKATRSGTRFADLYDKNGNYIHANLESKLRRLADGFKKRYGDLLQYDVEAELSKFQKHGEDLKPYVRDQTLILRQAKQSGDTVLVEGANATMLDLDCGTFPFVTSSNTGLGGVFTGLSLDWRRLKDVIGVVKAYTTRVGSGPFPTEQLNEMGEKLQTVGREFGVTTGRKRRCGWLDLVIVKYSSEVNNYTALNLTKLDILDDFDEIQVAIDYSLNGKSLGTFPANLDALADIEVVYKTMPGWKCTTTKFTKWNDLPSNAQKYVEYIEEFVGVPIRYVGTGPGREDMISR
ncbi:hypothetical protein MMC19_002133 [Ptychographa xylographoides]|nr:hypothetical protein [Ptychographa xylographoides]